MKLLRVVMLPAVAALFAANTFAQTAPINDPIVRTGGGRGSVAITSPIFRVVSPSGNSPALSTVPASTECLLMQPGKAPATVPGCLFKNYITTPRGVGITITRLTFIIDNAQFSGPLNCGTDTALFGSGPFSICGVQTGPDGTFSFITFMNGSVPFGGDFSLGMRGFNLNASFAAVALPAIGSSSTAEIYGLPYDAQFNVALANSAGEARQFRTGQRSRLKSASYTQQPQRGSGCVSRAAGACRAIQGIVWSSSNRATLDLLRGRSRIRFDARPSYGHLWRAT